MPDKKDSIKTLRKMPDTVTVNGTIVTNSLKANDTLITVSGIKDQPKQWYQGDGFKIATPLLVTFLLFFLGQMFTILWKKNDKRNLLINSKTSLETWVLQLEASIKNMFDSCQIFTGELLALEDVQRVTLEFTPTLVTKISEQNINDFQSFTIFYLTGNRTENETKAYNILQSIEIIKGYETEIVKQYDRFIADVDDLMETLNREQDGFNNALMKMLTEVGSSTDHIAYAFSHQINDHNSKFFEENKARTVKAFNEDYIDPMFKLIEEEMAKNAKNTYSALILPPLVKLAVAFKKWEVYQKGYAKIISEFGVRYGTAYTNLKKDILVLQQQNILGLWSIR